MTEGQQTEQAQEQPPVTEGQQTEQAQGQAPASEPLRAVKTDGPRRDAGGHFRSA